MTSKAEKRSDMNHTEEKLGTESLGSLMLSMGIPTLVAQMINLLYNIVDRVYIGQGVGRGSDRTGTGASGDHDRLGLQRSGRSGRSAAGSDCAGTGRSEKGRTDYRKCLYVAVRFSAIVMLVFYAAQKPFLYLVGASDATYPYASEYLSIYLIGTICVQIVLGLNPFITAQGTVKDSDGIGAHRGRPEYRSGSDLYLCVPYGS